MKKVTQEQQVIDALRSQGGYATLRRLNEILDFSTWKTHTPEASVRRIVQQSNHIFKIQPGLWALEEDRDYVLRRFKLQVNNPRSVEAFSHSYYQGLLIEIGKFRHAITYVPAQDQHHYFVDTELGEISDMVTIPPFTYEHLLRKARTVDVIWFNERRMPTHFYEVEHSTDIKNSLSKFYELQDFFSLFYIVADKRRKLEFEDKLSASIFTDIRDRGDFLDYDRVASIHSSLSQEVELRW